MMKKFGFGNLGSPLAVLLLLSLLVLGCRKDFAESDAHQSTLSISVEEVRQMMGDPSSGMVSSRSPIKVPLDYTPNWDNAILNTQTGAPLVIAAVDTCCIPPDMPVKGNLIFRKDSTGTINCSLMLWFKSSDSTYVDWRAPLWTQNTFRGLVALVDAQDTIRRVASYANGSISKVLVWNKNIRDLAEDELGAPPTVEDRGGPKCPRFGKTFWESVEDFFQEVIDDSGSFFNDWWDSINENPGYPPQEPYSFFFYEFSNSPNWTWIPAAGGGGGGQPAFENYRVECGIALQNFIANGFYLPEYAHLDMRLCELLSELYISDNSGTANTRLLCLYTNHQSAYFEEIWQYWDNSGEDQAARTVVNSFLDAACEENPSVQKAAMLRHAYCLGDMSLIDLWNRLTVECGQNFGLEISPCLAEIILSHANTSNSYQCPNGALANIINFARQHGLTVHQFLTLLQNEALFQQVKALAEGLNLNPVSVQWLIGNANATAGMHQFYVSHYGLENVEATINLLLDYSISKNINNPLEANFADYGENAFVCGHCFTTAWTLEYAILKRDYPCPPGDQMCDWLLRAEATWHVISTGVHIMLDMAGLVPGIGEIADLTNGALYALEGNYADATLSFTAAIPFVGWTATGAKYARKVVNLGGNFMELKYIVRSDGIIQFGENLESARSQLRTILKTPAGHQAHHIIPWQFWDHPVVQAAADVKIDGFHMNELINGISLPTSAGGNLPKHLGSHPDYDGRVFQSLEEIKNRLGNNMSPVAAAQELRDLIQDINAQIKATQGGTINDVSGW